MIGTTVENLVFSIFSYAIFIQNNPDIPEIKFKYKNDLKC